MEDVQGYLESKGVTLKPAPGGNIRTHCFFCNEDPSKRGRLYIDVQHDDPPGKYICFLCGESGAYNKLRRHFGDGPADGEQASESVYRLHEIWQEAATYYHQSLGEEPDVYRWLRDERGLSLETIVAHKIGFADGSLKLHLKEKGYSSEEIVKTGLMDQYGKDFLFEMVTIPYHQAGNVVQIRGKQWQGGERGGKYLTPPGQDARLFNIDSVVGADQVVVAEGEFDALVLEEQGYKAVGVPGANTWQDSWTSYFDDVRRVFVCFDNDTAGRKGAERVSHELSPKSRIITMPEPEPGKPKVDPTEFFVGLGRTTDDFNMLMIESKGGLLVTVDDAQAEWLEMEKMAGVKLGFPRFDSQITPGLLPSQLMIILAKTGVGKTLVLLNIFYRLAFLEPQMKILFVSLEQTRYEWFERARRIHRFHRLDATDSDALDVFRDRLMIVDRNRLTDEDLVDCLHQFEFEMGQKPDLVAIDYLGYWARSFRGEAYERTSAAVMALKAIAKDQRVAILTPHQVSRNVRFGEGMEADTGRDSGVVEETADFVLGLWSEDNRKDTAPEARSGKVKLKIMKSRHGGVGHVSQLQFGLGTLAMVPVEERVLAKRAELELAYRDAHVPDPQRDFFHQAMWRHVTGNIEMKFPKDEFDAWMGAVARGDGGSYTSPLLYSEEGIPYTVPIGHHPPDAPSGALEGESHEDEAF